MADVPQPTTAAPPPWWIVWGRLLRLPNLFTVPGDAAAGFLLASRGEVRIELAWSAAAVLLLYMAGLLLNDYFDRGEDAADRADRPIPAGHVAPDAVLIAGMALLIAGVALPWLVLNPNAGLVAAGIAVLVFVYDLARKQLGSVGAVLLGLCRGGSVLLGAAAVLATWNLPPLVWLAAATAFAYTLALSLVAAGETDDNPPDRRAYAPALVLIAAGLTLCAFAPGQTRILFGALLLALGAGEVWLAAKKLRAGDLPTPAFVGQAIRVMILAQAGWALAGLARHDQRSALAGLALFWILRRCADKASRRFYGS